MNNKEMENYLDQNEIKKLAVDLDNFSYDYDPYVYNDNVENKEEQVEKIIESIMNHDIEGFKEWLTTAQDEVYYRTWNKWSRKYYTY